jgi:GT2 family glycosyltransferase
MSERVGIVIIGRNEGERLLRCLESIRGRAEAVVYVDSGSTDGSVAAARGTGVDVVELDRDQPFTAARARNAGFARLRERAPEVMWVQFVDGDCRVAEGWLEAAVSTLASDPTLAVVCGRRRETNPGASVYNRLCDMEWDTPVGPARSCGGDAMMRAEAFERAGGFNPAVIAGEEPELCIRLRAAGWGIRRIDGEMTRHDAAMTRFSQWWRRNVRTGYGYALGAAMHGGPPEYHGVRAVRSIVLWAGVFPIIALAGAYLTRGLSLILLVLLYAAQVTRMYLRESSRARAAGDARVYAFFTLLGKLPQFVGVIKFWVDRARGVRAQIIEYKGSSASGAA